MKHETLREKYEKMSRTEYLFGVEGNSEFPEQEGFARRRIEMATKLKKSLSRIDIKGMTYEDKDALQDRYGEADEAMRWAEKLLADALEAKEIPFTYTCLICVAFDYAKQKIVQWKKYWEKK